ncbi:MAG: aromatic ring-hydroxylating dioxygenase subunit alpha, partial [Fimbriimonadaceae bacterium]|nr:aromatic ring-hydroxylating dioxygenase subunit alpha [Alphaproteobacteria bacterium]
MTHADTIAAQAEERLNKGLKQRWHPVLASYDVGSAPIGITRLSENIVLWRDTGGVVHAIEDRCPHRGARLSLGWNLGDRIACWYHGVEVDGTGTVRNVPAMDDCPLEGRTCIRAYPVQEKQGAVFLYFGDDLHQNPCELELPEQLASPDYSSFLCTAVWKCNYRYAIDNVMDPMHGAYLHAESHSMAFGEKSAEMKLEKTERGLYFSKKGQTGVNFDWVEYGDTGCMWLRLSIPYQPKFGPGGPFFIVGFATPMDEDHTMVFFWRIRRISGWQRNIWRFLYRNRLEGKHWDVLEQDRVVLEQMAPNARHQEFLYAHDVGL